MDPPGWVAEFGEHGCVLLPQLIDPDTLAECRRCFEWIVANPSSVGQQAFSSDDGGGFYSDDSSGDAGYREESLPIFEPLLRSGPFARVCHELWGSSENVWFEQHEVFAKTGGKGRRTPFHQDSSYSPYVGKHIAVFWIPFEPVPKANSLEVVAGSHKGPLYNGSAFNPNDDTRPLYKERNLEAANMDLPRLPDIQQDRGKWDIRSWATRPGDVVLFHPHCLHGGAPVDANFPARHSLVLRFFGDDCHYRPLPLMGKDGSAAASAGSLVAREKGLRAGEHFTLTKNLLLRLLGPGLASGAGATAGTTKARL